MEILVDGVHYTLNAGDLCVIFPNQSSFNRAFLKYCGENPTEHRRNLRSHGNAL